ncbi:MAG: chitobiase/beta-hexosaminidase C-terminal domain-containing protein, partial [Syntrophales bacterium LBB04]|nr:chitobiase/beta-hexosaminidase C-terminal domain-containing protein [Syntrophales bacterium LBB04]
YVTDAGNQTIRKLVINTGAVATLAGSAGDPGTTDGMASAARFHDPAGMTTDGASLYVADAGNDTVRKLSVDTRPIVTSVMASSPTNSLSIPLTITANRNIAGSAVAAYLVTTSSTPPAATASGWSTRNPFIYDTAKDGVYVLHGWVKDADNNVSLPADPVMIVVDTTPPITTASPEGGAYGAEQSVSLSATETSTIYYTTNGTDPTEFSSVYSTPIQIAATTSLRYFAKDWAGNKEQVKRQTYTIDTVAPITTANPPGGTYGSAQTVTLSANEDAVIYYATNPSESLSKYSTPIQIAATITLKFFAKDTAGNVEPLKSVVYNITSTLKGDIDGNGSIELTDAVIAMQLFSGFTSAKPVNKYADVDGNGRIGPPEVIYVLQKVAGIR